MRRGFTVVEMLIVMAVIAVLAAALYPISQRVEGKAKGSHCLNNLRQIGMGINAYLAEHQMMLPTLVAARADKNEDVATLDNSLNAYISDARVFRCNADKGQWEQTGTSYYWNSTLNGQSINALNFFKVESAQGIPVISDKEGWHRFTPSKVNILYADGHVTEGLQFSLTP